MLIWSSLNLVYFSINFNFFLSSIVSSVSTNFSNVLDLGKTITANSRPSGPFSLGPPSGPTLAARCCLFWTNQIARLFRYFLYSKSESQYKLFDQSVIVDEKNEKSIYSWINAFVAKTYAQLAEKQISLCKVGTLLLGLSIKRVLLYCRW